MPRGGYKPGGGRPKGSKSKVNVLPPPPPAQTLPVASATGSGDLPATEGTTPLAYMLAIMNDPNADPVIRSRMAIAAAPFVHTRVAEVGKKEEKAKAAKTAAGGKFAPAAPPKRLVN